MDCDILLRDADISPKKKWAMPLKPKLYLETSIVSYLTAKPSHDLVRAAHQQVTRDWWETRFSFDLYISQFVLDEAKAGNAEAAGRRLSALREALLLELTPETGRLAREILRQGGMPAGCVVSHSRHGLPADVELYPHRQCRPAW